MDVKEKIGIVCHEMRLIKLKREELKREYLSEWKLIDVRIEPNGFERTWEVSVGDLEKFEYENRLLLIQYNALRDELNHLEHELAL